MTRNVANHYYSEDEEMPYMQHCRVSEEALTDFEREVWRMKDVVIKSIGGLPENVNNIYVVEYIKSSSPSSLVRGTYHTGTFDIEISRCELSSPESFIGVLLHEIAHAKSEADDATKEFENTLTDYLGYLGTSLVRATANNPENVIPSKSLDLRSFAYATAKCLTCFGDSFDVNEDKSFVKCKICGREYKGGYAELVDLNRKYIEEHGMGMFKEDIANAIMQMFSKE